jgi:hypothetical protein
MVSEGKVGFRDVEKAFQTMSAEGGLFFNLMDTNAKTVGGRISNLGDAWEQLKAQIGRSQRGIIAGTVSFAEDMVSTLEASFKRANDLEAAFSKFGAKQLGAFEFRTEKDRLRGQFSFYDEFGKRSAGNEKQAKIDLRTLTYQLKNLNKTLLGETEFNRQEANIKHAMSLIQGDMSLQQKKGSSDASGDVESAGTSTGKGGSTNIEARQPVNFNIDINKLVEKIEITQNNIKDSAATIKEEVTKALIEAVNDFNLQASR